MAKTRQLAIALAAAALLAACGGGAGDPPEKLIASAKEYIAKNDNQAAVIQLKNALQKDINSAEARFLLGKTLLAQGDAVAAAVELRKARELKYDA
jgi:Flp pilus assembly protein TadD